MLRGMDTLDDAGVYRLADDLALIQTIDFFTPIVDDPYMFGQIAVANALSDVYAMGGQPLTAMNVVCFPIKTMHISVLKEILRGGLDKIREAGVVLVGGHTVEDAELKYGLSVTGTVHPEKLLTNSGARVGDKLVLTKPLGTGIIATALKADAVNEETLFKVTSSMAALNDRAAELMREMGAHAVTDITGFGLLGHASQLAVNSRVGLKITSVPVFPEAVGLAGMGFCPAGLYRNREFYSSAVKIDVTVPRERQDVLFDPQTSGGLLISLLPDAAGRLVEGLHQSGVPEAAVVGEVVSRPRGKVLVV